MGSGALGMFGNLSKILLFFSNFVFFVLGIALVGAGLWATVSKDAKFITDLLGKSDVATNIVVTTANLVIAIGSFVLVVGFFGCWGAVRESKCMLISYAIFLCILLIMEFAAAGLAAAYKGKVEETMDKHIPSVLQTTYQANEDVKKLWDRLHVEKECCGFTGPEDFTEMPESCCKLEGDYDFMDPSTWKPIDKDGCKAKTEGTYNTKSCKDDLLKIVKSNLTLIAGVTGGIIVTEVVGILLGICLYKSIQTEEEEEAEAEEMSQAE